jgi:hypothetical protein
MGVAPQYNPPKNPQPGQKVSSYGHTFTWTELHKNAEELNAMVYTYDKVGTDAVDRLQVIAPPSKENHHAQRDLFKLVKENAAEGGAVGKLWAEVNTVPEWVDWDQIDRGQKVFWRYVGPTLVAVSPSDLCSNVLIT